jgi:hypothetical protein
MRDVPPPAPTGASRSSPPRQRRGRIIAPSTFRSTLPAKGPWSIRTTRIAAAGMLSGRARSGAAQRVACSAVKTKFMRARARSAGTLPGRLTHKPSPAARQSRSECNKQQASRGYGGPEEPRCSRGPLFWRDRPTLSRTPSSSTLRQQGRPADHRGGSSIRLRGQYPVGTAPFASSTVPVAPHVRDLRRHIAAPMHT